jgi:hypothetical protein
LLIAAFSIGMHSCVESTIVPNRSNTSANKLQDLLTNRWVVSSYVGSGIDSSSNYSGEILNFNDDGTYEFSSPFAPRMRGRWILNTDDSTIALIPSNNTESERLKITLISNDSISYRSLLDNRVITRTLLNRPIFSFTGALDFKENIQIPANHRLSVIWEVHGLGQPFLMSWGSGRINEFNRTYSISFDAYPPDSAISILTGCAYSRVAVGHVVIHADKTVDTKNYSILNQFPSNPIGIVKDRAIIYAFGNVNANASTCTWSGKFPRGYNLGKAIFSSNGLSGGYTPWVSTLPTDNILYITSDRTQYQLPQWWMD